jgi:glutamine amidotransferase
VYFVHSYAAAPSGDTIATFTHGTRFGAVVSRGQVMGAQFHPERSSTAGARLLKNFLALS